ncbi:glutathione S-transferase family protein [Phenylobacterium sp.]|uniref:glutathione S-transferase family protein n=1 Tax=Phenylobacterium sp. TaxID=1871053 RepID=UPI00301CD764
MAQSHYLVHGSLGSPYTMKMRAVMRYRRLPHVWIRDGNSRLAGRTGLKVAVIPVIQYLDGSYHNDSTPMIDDLERLHPGERSIVPDDPGDAFLAYLLEDFADEWVTKAMFHYRWFRARDQDQMGHWLGFDLYQGQGLEKIRAFAREFRDRQVGRLALVGCTEANQYLVEETCRRTLAALERHVTDSWFFFGSRPSRAEFGLYGQLSQFIVDPTPTDILRATAPYTARWVMNMDDIGGIDGEWAVKPVSASVEEMLKLTGEVYLPFLVANARAYSQGAETMSFTALGETYSQGVFRYQVKCLETLRSAYAALDEAARARIDPLLDRTGCLPFLRAA